MVRGQYLHFFKPYSFENSNHTAVFENMMYLHDPTLVVLRLIQQPN